MPFFVKLASRTQRWQYRGLVAAWLLGQAAFWTWWLQADHVVTPLGMLINSMLLLWTTFLPAWYLFFLGRGKRPNPDQPLPNGRVAMVVTKAPSEPWSVVRRTLEAMLAQVFPRAYDVWLADEDPTSETRAWCAAHGVQISCRKGVAGYNNLTWPRRQKCKEGNLAYFYEVMGGYAAYDFVSQLDADHVPEPGYLAEIIRPFADPSIGYVAAPSMCDANAASSWAARGRLFAEAAWHGTVQAGLNSGFAPQCIGSHYAVRTAALREIGGLGPDLAEDFSTTLEMNAAGWRGAFAFDAAAHGDGPATVADAIVQEFQWARSVANIFLSLWSKQRGNLPRRVRLQLGFVQVWYFLFTLNMAIGLLLPIVALVSRTPWVRVGLWDFVLHSSVSVLSMLLTVAWVRLQGWLRPRSSAILSWEAILFEFVRWPWMLLGIGQAVIGRVTRTNFSFRVTPKGDSGAQVFPRRVLVPFVAIVLAEAGAALLIDNPGDASGYLCLALLSALTYTAVVAALVVLHVRENTHAYRIPWREHFRTILRATPATALAVAICGSALATRGDVAFAAVVPHPNASVVSNTAALDPALPVPVDAPIVQALPLPIDRVAIGVYDPTAEFAGQGFDLEQQYVHQSDPTLFAQSLDAAAQSSRTPLLTIEPWPAVDAADPSGLQTVIDGADDADLRALADIATAHAPQIILVRWGHEMDLADVYPWGAQPTQQYIAAYRHVAAVFAESGATNVRFVWAPAGNANAPAYYPGDDVVDYVGVTVLEDAGWDASFGLQPQSFDDIFRPRYERVAAFGKPVIVTELGVSGTAEHQADWLAAARTEFSVYPALGAVLYFDAVNPPVNKLPDEPDWRLDATSRVAWVGATQAATVASGRADSAATATA